MATLSNNIARAIRDFDNIGTAIEDMGVEVPKGTPTSSYDQKIKEIEQGITPTGTINITENDNDIDVTQYATANVNVPQGVFPSGNLEITENNTYDVTEYEEVTVAVPQPSGKITLTENATDVDISEYATADIAVPQGVFPEGTYEISDNGTYDVINYANVDIDVPSDITVNEQYTVENDTLTRADITLNGEIVATIPDGVVTIGNHAFYQDHLITSISVPDSVANIENYAFVGCENFTEIVIPSSVAYVGETSFYDCINLSAITVSEDNLTYDSRSNCNAIIHTKLNMLVTGCKTTVIPDTITSIGVRAFAGCTSLTNINIPNNVIEIRERAFQGCTSLTNITIGDGVTRINNYMFTDCRSLISIAIGNSVTSIGDGVFTGCTHLESIIIPNSLASVQAGVFQPCYSLTDIYYIGTQEQWEAITGISDAGIPQSTTIHYNYTPE